MGLPLYTNFTSPIRKFNDFYVHRLIKNKINGAPYHQLTPENITALQNRQMTSRQAANETENWLKWQYMESLAGQTFQGVIQRSNSAGFFVKLTDNGIEGFVSTKDMPEKYSFDQVYMTLKSKSRTFTLDQVLTVKCGRVDKKRHQIIFDIVEEAKPDEVVSNDSPAQENTVPQS
jgi:ribonuclease R